MALDYYAIPVTGGGLMTLGLCSKGVDSVTILAKSATMIVLELNCNYLQPYNKGLITGSESSRQPRIGLICGGGRNWVATLNVEFTDLPDWSVAAIVFTEVRNAVRIAFLKGAADLAWEGEI